MISTLVIWYQCKTLTKTPLQRFSMFLIKKIVRVCYTWSNAQWHFCLCHMFCVFEFIMLFICLNSSLCFCFLLYSQICLPGHKRRGEKSTNSGNYWVVNPSIQTKKLEEKMKVTPIFSHASYPKVTAHKDFLGWIHCSTSADISLLWLLMLLSWRQYKGKENKDVKVLSLSAFLISCLIQTLILKCISGQRNTQLYSGWSDDRGCFHSWLSLRHICLGWPGGGCQSEITSYEYWRG